MSKNQLNSRVNAQVEVKPYSIKELAGIYGVCSRTLKKWMLPFQEELGKPTGWFYTIPQVEIIFAKLSLPHIMTTSDTL